MPKKRAPETASEIVQALHEFLSGPEPDFADKPPEEVQRYLKRRNLDAGSVLSTVQEELQRARGELELQEAHNRRGKALNKLAALTARSTAGAKEDLLEQIRGLAGPQQAAVYFRRLESASDEDLRSILEDLERLEKLGELSNNDAEE